MVIPLKRKEMTPEPGFCALAFAQEKAKARFMRSCKEGCSTAHEIAVGAAYNKATASGKKLTPEGTGNGLPRCSSIFSMDGARQRPIDPEGSSQKKNEEKPGCSTALEIAVGHAFAKAMAEKKDH